MATGKSFLTARDVALINQIRRDALATKIALQDPQITISIRRVVSGNPVDLPGQIVALKVAYPGSPASTDRDVLNDDRMRGTISAEALDAMTSDTFLIPNTRWMATVVMVHPPKADSIIVADIEIDAGSGR